MQIVEHKTSQCKLSSRLSHLLLQLHWKHSGPILKGKDNAEVNKKRTYKQEKKEAIR